MGNWNNSITLTILTQMMLLIGVAYKQNNCLSHKLIPYLFAHEQVRRLNHPIYEQMKFENTSYTLLYEMNIYRQVSDIFGEKIWSRYTKHLKPTYQFTLEYSYKNPRPYQ